MKIPKTNVDLCSGDLEDPTKLLNAQREQHRDDGKSKAISRPSRNVSHDDESDDIDIPSEDEVECGDETMPSKASKSTTSHPHKKPKLGGIHDMFDVKGREGVDLAIARFFLACGIPFNAACSSYFEQILRAITGGPAGYKALDYEKL